MGRALGGHHKTVPRGLGRRARVRRAGLLPWQVSSLLNGFAATTLPATRARAPSVERRGALGQPARPSSRARQCQRPAASGAPSASRTHTPRGVTRTHSISTIIAPGRAGVHRTSGHGRTCTAAGRLAIELELRHPFGRAHGWEACQFRANTAVLGGEPVLRSCLVGRLLLKN